MDAALKPDVALGESRPQFNPWLIAMTVMLATFMEVLDTSVANVALPHIAGGLSADVDASTWVLTSYLVSNAIVLPLSGWFSSLFGRKRFFIFCVGLFTLSSFACGLATSLQALILFRVVQGIGGGALQPISQAILVESFPPQKRGIAMGIFGMGVVVAPIVGPTLGGWLTDSYSWRWIFFINVPVGMLSIFLTTLIVSDPPYLTRHKLGQVRIDYIGLGLISLGLGALQIVLDKGQRDDWFASRTIAMLTVVTVTCLLVFILWELRCKSPVVNLRLLKDRNFSVAVLTMFMLGFALYASIVLLPLFLQRLMGYTATLSGLVLSPGGILTLFMMPVVGMLVSRVQPRYLVMVGLVIMAYSLFYMSGFSLQMSFRTPVIARLIQGVGLAFLFVPINAAAFQFIAKEKTNDATGIINLVRNVGGSSGVAFATTLVARRTQLHQNMLAGHLSPFEPMFRNAIGRLQERLIEQGSHPFIAARQALAVVYRALLRQAAVKAYIDCFWVLAFLMVALIPVLLLLRKAKAQHVPTVHA
jgi:DHA2 family multidrug resistance protein